MKLQLLVHNAIHEHDDVLELMVCRWVVGRFCAGPLCERAPAVGDGATGRSDFAPDIVGQLGTICARDIARTSGRGSAREVLWRKNAEGVPLQAYNPLHSVRSTTVYYVLHLPRLSSTRLSYLGQQT